MTRTDKVDQIVNDLMTSVTEINGVASCLRFFELDDGNRPDEEFIKKLGAAEGAMGHPVSHAAAAICRMTQKLYEDIDNAGLAIKQMAETES